MWFLELCVDNGAEYETVFEGLFESAEQAEKEAARHFKHMKILKFVKMYTKAGNING